MELLNDLLHFFSKRKAKVYLVGGCVRDRMLGRDRFDVDIAVLGNASSLAKAFADEIQGAFYVMDDQNDVARVIQDHGGDRYYVDFAQVRGDTIEQDLATRDFTVNAMALEISNGSADEAELNDPFDGRNDLIARRLRAVAESVFENDPIRLLRGVRFEATLGFSIDPATEALVRRDARQLVDASSERVRDEFSRIVSAEGSVRNLHRLDELGLLEFILPEVVALKGVTQSAPHSYDVFEHTIQAVGAFEEIERAHFLNIAEGAFSEQLELHFGEMVTGGHRRSTLLRIALLLHDAGKLNARTEHVDGRVQFIGHEATGERIAELAMQRLRFSNDESLLVSRIVAQHLRPIWLAASKSVNDRAVYRFFRATGNTGVDVALHSWCDQKATYGQTEYSIPESELQQVIARLLDRFYHAHDRIVDPPRLLTGTEVMEACGINAGPRVGELLDALREAEASGDVVTREQAIEFVRHELGNGAGRDSIS